MKQIIFYTAVAASIITASAFSMNDIIRAFKSGNASEVSQYLDNSVEITLNGQNSTYNKKQATTLLSDFFSQHKVSAFKVLHQSESGGTAYCIGNLVTSDGTYRVTLFAKEKSSRTLLQEIRFEK